MMDKYTASNGATVNETAYPGFKMLTVKTPDNTITLAGVHVDALREFFQAERDDANGVWRSRIDPAWTAVHEEGHSTIQFRNDDGMREFALYPDGSNLSAWSPALREIGAEYIEAHPERKPWHDAEEGEIWVLTGAGGLEQPWRRASGKWRSIGTVLERTYDAASAIAGRRIWPEAS